jgi:predicted N-acetyltransferase YhbS
MKPHEALQLTYRIATATGLEPLVAMINAAFSVEEFLEGTRTDAAQLAAMMAKGQILVAEEPGGQVVATLFMENRGASAYLGMLAVDPAWQGKGIARALTAEAERRLHEAGCRKVEIIVLNMRPELPPLYSSWGFRQVGTTEFTPHRAVKPGVEIHGIRMEKTLPGR